MSRNTARTRRRDVQETSPAERASLIFGARAEELERIKCRRDAAVPSALRCLSWIGVMLAAQAVRPARVVVDVPSNDPLDSRAERAIRRLVTIAPGVSLTVVADDPTPDQWTRLRRAGAQTIVTPDGTVLPAGRPRWKVQEWETWLLETCGLRADQDTEAILLHLASAGERGACSDDLVRRGLAASRPAAVRRLREVSKQLGGEEYRSPGIVAREAHRAIVGLSSARPLNVALAIDPPILTSALRLERSPSVAVAAGLTSAEIDALRDLARRVSDVERDVGAPHGGASRDERDWAAGRRAAELGADAGTIASLKAQCLTDAQGAALAIGDALHEAPDAPRARLAAAIEALAVLPESVRPTWSTGAGGESWNAERPWMIANADASLLPDGLARRLTSELDELLVAHGALDRWVESGRGGSTQS